MIIVLIVFVQTGDNYADYQNAKLKDVELDECFKIQLQKKEEVDLEIFFCCSRNFPLTGGKIGGEMYFRQGLIM